MQPVVEEIPNGDPLMVINGVPGQSPCFKTPVKSSSVDSSCI